MHVPISILKLAALALVLAWPAQAAQDGTARCFEDWSDAVPIMRQEGLLGTGKLHELARHRLPGHLVHVMLCRDGSRYIYRLLMRDERGRLSILTVDARRPFER